MATISAETVKTLRERTGAGMMDCKRALEATAGDLSGAAEWLRKQGIAKAAKKAGRSASEGMIAEALSADGASVVFVEVNCETDFVAKNDEFRAFAAAVAQLALQQNPATVEALRALPLNGTSIAQRQTELTAKIGENIVVERVVRRTATAQQKNGRYIHAGEKIGVLVIFDDPNGKLTPEAAKDVAMHVAAMDPPYVRRETVPAATVEREREIIRAQLASEQKPAEILEKIVAGRINKFYAEQCLEEQVFVKDPQGKQTVSQALKALDAQIRIAEMVRLQVGDREGA